MDKIKKLAFAMFVVAGASGCASNQVAELARGGELQAPAAEHAAAADAKVMRALPSYGSMGGYRYRRFAVAIPVAG